MPEKETASDLAMLTTYEVAFQGGMLKRGFWLYVWEISLPDGTHRYYVGRTGDSSSKSAQSPFNRMGQHLGIAKSNMLRRHLDKHGIEPEACVFRLVAVGPLEAESKDAMRHQHDERRDLVAAMEKTLAESLSVAGCQVLNRVACRKPLDRDRYAQVRHTFAAAFPHLNWSAGLPSAGDGAGASEL